MNPVNGADGYKAETTSGDAPANHGEWSLAMTFGLFGTVVR